MTRAGFKVPEGFVLSCRFFSSWYSELHNTREWDAVQEAMSVAGVDILPNTILLQEQCMKLEMNELQQNELEEALASIPGTTGCLNDSG